MSVLVLAIDDSATMRRSLDIAFSSDEFSILSRATLAEAMEVARNDRPAIALIDASLPGTSLFQACSALRSEVPNLLVVALVAGDHLLDPTEIERCAIADQVVKPFACDRLNEIVWRALRAEAERQREREERAQPQVARTLVDGEILTPSRHRLAEALSVITGVEVTLLRALGVEGVSIRRDAVVWDGASIDRSLRSVVRKPGLRTSLPLLIRDSAELWESLASHGIVPMDWIGSTQRLFVRDGALGQPQPAPDLGLIAAMAADVDLVFTAESLAVEALPGPFEVDDPPFVWRLLSATETERLALEVAAKPHDPANENHEASAARQLLALGVAIDPNARATHARCLCIPALGAPARERTTAVVAEERPGPSVTPDLSPEASTRRRALGDDLHVNIERLDAHQRGAQARDETVAKSTPSPAETTPPSQPEVTESTNENEPTPAVDLPDPPQLERALWEVIPTMAKEVIRRVFQQLKGE